MVHVTFNEKVECHQYSPTHPEGIQPLDDRNRPVEVASSSVQRQSSLKYNMKFLKNLRDTSLSRGCPDVVKRGMEDGKPWAGYVLSPSTSIRQIGKGTVFFNHRPPYNNSNKQRRSNEQLIPFFQSHPFGYGDEVFAPLQAIGSRRGQSNNRNYGQDFFNRNLQTKKSNDEDGFPEWYTYGPTSMNDRIELVSFDEDLENHTRNDQLGCVDGNISIGPTSGASSNNGSPPAKSTPAKVPHALPNDSQRFKRPALGRSNNWQNNFDNRQRGGAGTTPFLNEFFKNFSGAQNQSNLRGLPPIARVEDVESSLLYDRLRFKQMVAQLQSQAQYQTQNLYRNSVYPQHEPIPTAAQILSEIDKILRTSTDPVYKRPEVRALIKNIVEAVIPPINIMNLLKNPLTEPHNRETIQTALKLITQAKNNATNAMKMHTPTESELRAHMDAILQDAILKKRMETLSNELLKGPLQQGVRNFPNPAFHQMFKEINAGRFENHSQGDLAQENNLNRWFSPTLLNKGLSGELPQIPSDQLRSEELESTYKQKLKGNEKDVK